MAQKAYATCINQLKLDKKSVVNDNIKTTLIPDWVGGKDFRDMFLPFLTIKFDSREQDAWISNACDYYGIKCERAVKNKKEKTENLKEGDITFAIQFGDEIFDFTNEVAYERKGSPSELYNNCTADRERVEAEFERQLAKGYKKFVLLLEIGNHLLDLINYKFYYYGNNGGMVEKSFNETVFGTVISWSEPNKYNFQILQVDTQSRNKTERFNKRQRLFWLMLLDMFYYFRQYIRLLYAEKFLEKT